MFAPQEFKTKLNNRRHPALKLNLIRTVAKIFFEGREDKKNRVTYLFFINSPKKQKSYARNSTRLAKVASYKTSQKIKVSCTQLVVLNAPFKFGSEHNFLDPPYFSVLSKCCSSQSRVFVLAEPILDAQSMRHYISKLIQKVSFKDTTLTQKG